MLKLDEIEKGTPYYPIIEAYTLAKDIFSNLKPDQSLLFNVMILINADLRKTIKSEDGFYFNKYNTFDKTTLDLNNLFSDYIVKIDSNKRHKSSYMHGMSDFNKLMFINFNRINKFEYKKQVIAIFLVLLHEFAHTKRVHFCCFTHGLNSPIIVTNHKGLGVGDKMDIGTFLEFFLLVNYFIMLREINIIIF
jgi:hypothetical protein